jgi:hypothetical protein
MSASLAKATLQTFATIAGGVLASERKRLGEGAGTQAIGEWIATVMLAAFDGSRRDAAYATLGLAAAAWAVAGLSLDDLQRELPGYFEQARCEWRPHVDKAAAVHAAQALDEARRK